MWEGFRNKESGWEVDTRSQMRMEVKWNVEEKKG